MSQVRSDIHTYIHLYYAAYGSNTNIYTEYILYMQVNNKVPYRGFSRTSGYDGDEGSYVGLGRISTCSN